MCVYYACGSCTTMSDIKATIYYHCYADDWRVDGYRWFQYGTKFIPRNSPEVKKVHFATVLPSSSSRYDSRFRRQAYFLLSSQQSPMVLIHYIGDESIATTFPHGNSKSRQIFYRTYPSVMNRLAASTGYNLPANIYKREVSKGTNFSLQYQPHLLPRNSRQVINIQHSQRQKNRLSHDALYNAHELVYDLGGFVKTITTYPDLMIVCGLDEIVKELGIVLKVESSLPQLLSYDTTFQLGDFYVSPLLYRQVTFANSPVIPALFLIHERKFQGVHELFMRHVAKLVPSLVRGKKMVPLVTDEEVGIFQVRQ